VFEGLSVLRKVPARGKEVGGRWRSFILGILFVGCFNMNFAQYYYQQLSHSIAEKKATRWLGVTTVNWDDRTL
jgi:hypothetical protein